MGVVSTCSCTSNTKGNPSNIAFVMSGAVRMRGGDKCKKFGANIIIEGNHVGEAKEYAQQTSEGKIYVNGYDDHEIIAGAGTMGIEIIEDVPCVDTVVVPVGGAGLIAGVACAVKTLKPSVSVFGVEPEFAGKSALALLSYEFMCSVMSDCFCKSHVLTEVTIASLSPHKL